MGTPERRGERPPRCRRDAWRGRVGARPLSGISGVRRRGAGEGGGETGRGRSGRRDRRRGIARGGHRERLPARDRIGRGRPEQVAEGALRRMRRPVAIVVPRLDVRRHPPLRRLQPRVRGAPREGGAHLHQEEQEPGDAVRGRPSHAVEYTPTPRPRPPRRPFAEPRSVSLDSASGTGYLHSQSGVAGSFIFEPTILKPGPTFTADATPREGKAEAVGKPPHCS